ncbi:hypothetical protein J2X68_007699 [Streptomyces sp. 3330]|nr:hypothetical protein [Streptomyces sp. 3330]MDR6980957.1 hypothetical protein [Streptomyces sp. 3330]
MPRTWTGWTLHRLRHSALTHYVEGATSTPIVLARPRQVAERDPAAGRRG